MLGRGLRRFAVALALAVAVSGGFALLLALGTGAAPGRALAVGFYLAGSFLVVGGFFVGNRGPARLDREEEAGPLGLGGRRRVRWATPSEREDALNTSALFVALGLALLALGVLADSRQSLF